MSATNRGGSVIYDKANLKGDLSGGFIAGVIALPLALAFGVQSGLGAAAGLYGAIAVGIFAAAFGGTRTQASGPTGPMTVVSAAIVAYAIERTGSIEAGLGIALLAFALGGVFQIVLGLLRVGKYVRYFPYPVVSGFMSGVGLIIIFLQIWPFLGSKSPKSVIEVFTRINEPLGAINGAAVGLGVLTLVTYYAFPRLTKKVPAVLAALVVGTGVGIGMTSSGIEVPVIGDIPSGFPALRVAEMFRVSPEHAWFIVESGVTLALLGSIDSLLTSVIADNITKDRHDSNRELVGQGIGNIIAAAFGGIPGAGATKGTVVNINAGGKTRLSGVVHGLFQLAVLLGAGAIASKIPLSVLAGLLISVGVAIIDTKGFKHIKSVPRADSAVMLVVLVWTVFGNLIRAVAAGIVMASVLFMKKMGDMAEEQAEITERPEPEVPWDDEERLAAWDEVYIKHLSGPLFFGSSAGFLALARTLPDDIDVLVIRMDRVPYIDQSGLYALEEAVSELHRRDVLVAIVGIQKQPLARLQDIELVPALITTKRLFPDVETCEKWLRSRQ